MTVKELIEDLNNYDGGYEVAIDTVSDKVVCVAQEKFQHDKFVFITGFGSNLKNKIK